MRLIIAPTCKPTGWAPAYFRGRSSWGNRSPEDVDSVCAHQTAVRGGFGPPDLAGLIQRLGGTSRRRRGVPYHYFVSLEHDAVIALWHPRMYAHHGNGANSRSIGLAFDGRWPGDPYPSPEHLEQGLALAVSHASAEGFHWLKWLDAHRQYSGARGGDPGPRLWHALERTGTSLGLDVRPNHTRGSGKTIPSEWRP